MAEAQPEAVAIHFPTSRTEADGESRRVVYTEMTYRQLDERSSAIAAGLLAHGLNPGDRVALMVKPSPELFALTFGMFKAGLVPVMIDPGIGRSALKSCLARSEPVAFIGIPAAHAARLVLGWGRATVRHLVTVGRRWFWGGSTLQQIERLGERSIEAGHELLDISPDQTAAILFTTRPPGPPKGVAYPHSDFVAQVESIRTLFGIEPAEVDLPTIPL